MDVLVVGQIARDLSLRIDEVPGPGRSAGVRDRRELLGGKGANCAVAAAQLDAGISVGLLGVIGDDVVGDALLAQAKTDRLVVDAVARRPRAVTGLVVEMLEPGGSWRYLEDLGESVLLTSADVLAAAPVVQDAAVVVLQGQQPIEALVDAARLAREAGGSVVLDGAPHEDGKGGATVADLLACVDVLRADPAEARQLTGRGIDGIETAVAAGRDLLRRGPSLVVLGIEGLGNVGVWDGGELFLPLEGDAVDTTGGGDSMTAAIAVSWLRGQGPAAAVRAGVQASSSTVAHQAGRPDLPPDLVDRATS